MKQIFKTLAKPEPYRHKKSGRKVYVQERSEAHVGFRQSGYLTITPMDEQKFLETYEAVEG